MILERYQKYPKAFNEMLEPFESICDGRVGSINNGTDNSEMTSPYDQ